MDTKTNTASATQAADTPVASNLPAERQAPKPPLINGGRVAAIVPQDFESAYRLATVVVKSGMAPKSLDTVEKATVAIMHGLEVGFTPMAALQSIAVVNGMPTIYGDGMLALVRASGLLEDIVETVEDDKDGPTIAICKVKRAGQPNWTVQTFTRPQAMKASLWKKTGPWSQYPQRMMQMRARSWALRDAFADVLRGLTSAEEAGDMVDITSRGNATTSAPEPRRSDYAYSDAGSDHDAAGNEPAEGGQEPSGDNEAPADQWRVTVPGQEGATSRLLELIGLAQSSADLDAIEEANSERYGKFTQSNRAKITIALEDKREDLATGA